MEFLRVLEDRKATLRDRLSAEIEGTGVEDKTTRGRYAEVCYLIQRIKGEVSK